MEEVAQGFALVFAGTAIGWTAMYSFMVAPQAFRDLDPGRANRFVRNAMKDGHPIAAGLSGLGALGALLSQSVAGAAVLAVCAGLYFLVRIALMPPADEPGPKAARRRLKTGRIVASMMTLMILLALIIAAVLIALGV